MVSRVGERTIASLGEAGVIALFAKGAEGVGLQDVIVGNGDDAAAWVTAPGVASMATTDTLVEGVHFDPRFTSFKEVGRKWMAVNFSDIAAMGARPRYVLLSLSLSPDTAVVDLEDLAWGVHNRCEAHGIVVLGGNVCRTTGPMVLCATALGAAKKADIVSRRGSVPQDGVYVTGTLGDAYGGYRLTQPGVRVPPDAAKVRLLRALHDPEPRIEAGVALSASGAVHAMCDVSDGLGQDLRNLLAPFGLGARLDAASIPLSPVLRTFAEMNGVDPLEAAFCGGEDYELLFTAPMDAEPRLRDAARAAGVPVTRMGVVQAELRFEVDSPEGGLREIPTGFTHF